MAATNRKKKKTAPAPKIETGIVEGFYGAPWTAAARARIIDFMPAAGFRTYIYAPKDDPFHRERWKEEYPPAENKHLAGIIRRCAGLDIDFCWALSPGLSIKYSSRKDFLTLARKFESVGELGVRTFALFLDDIPPQLAHAADKKKWDSLASAQADLVNRLNARLGRSGARVWFCPTEYIGTRPTPYLETIGAEIEQGIDIFWTGALVVSPRVSAADARSIGKILRRKPILWDNYPVNDYNVAKLNLGPVRARDAAVPGLLAGYFTNPMNQAAASIIPMLTISDYLRDPAGYDPDASWEAALAAPWGEKLSAPARSALRDFCALWPAGFFFGEPQPETHIAVAEAREGRTAHLRKLSRRIIAMPEKLAAHPELRLFLNEVRPFMRGLVKDAKAALAATEYARKPADAKLGKAARRALKIAGADPVKPTAGNILRVYSSQCLNK